MVARIATPPHPPRDGAGKPRVLGSKTAGLPSTAGYLPLRFFGDTQNQALEIDCNRYYLRKEQ